MNIIILLRKTPSDVINHTAYEYCLSALKRKHTITCVFFYGDAVYNALTDEHTTDADIPLWKKLYTDYQIPLLCCQTALASRRHIALPQKPYQLSSTEMLFQQSIIADRVITF